MLQYGDVIRDLVRLSLHSVVKNQFALCNLDDLLFNSIFSVEPVDLHCLSLSQLVRSANDLQVRLCVDVTVEDNHAVCSLQLDILTANPGVQQEDKVLRIVLIELSNRTGTSFQRHGSQQRLIVVLLELAVAAQDIHCSQHLSIDQHLVALLLELL